MANRTSLSATCKSASTPSMHCFVTCTSSENKSTVLGITKKRKKVSNYPKFHKPGTPGVIGNRLKTGVVVYLRMPRCVIPVSYDTNVSKSRNP